MGVGSGGEPPGREWAGDNTGRGVVQTPRG
jgi:hypothetical protein